MHYLALITALLGLITLSTSSPFNVTDRNYDSCVCTAPGQWCGIRSRNGYGGGGLSGFCKIDGVWGCKAGDVGHHPSGPDTDCVNSPGARCVVEQNGGADHCA
ncbi:hypothetical protein N431DRAFT_467120 [Stipitochalara longipes BDJ]|nr:hypothetical protein N431DRAFT_467120 [Stipitochalara longipes BDJ]